MAKRSSKMKLPLFPLLLGGAALWLLFFRKASASTGPGPGISLPSSSPFPPSGTAWTAPSFLTPQPGTPTNYVMK